LLHPVAVVAVVDLLVVLVELAEDLGIQMT
jgi:hypothetical protein